jgi:hypothetical protein
MKNWVLG